ncbi:MAG: restriction endonuclease [Acidobacteria bacterium]|nr:restriction endonuclease [Acidobacteriota bacterium]
MPSYDFRSLSSYDFELLARDLLQEELHVRLESFAKGPDGGVDFRFQNAEGDLVVQCKHYANYDDLFKILKRDEAPKVNRLKPIRYILAVSTPLTPYRKDAILALFAPYCRASADIIGREDLNNLLGLHPGVERKQFKLWLTSEAVLTRLLQGGIWGDAELTVQRIRQRTSRYVRNPSLGRARQILDKHQYCIIAGIPGIGKITLAEILLIEYVDRHGFQAIRIANDLSEIKPVKNQENRQIFYFDDFLGKTALDKLQKNEDQRLLEFIEEVAANKNWRFILTTREYILNAAKTRYETLAQPPVDLTPCIIELSDYTHPIRARILYNHIFFSDLPNTYKRALLENRRYEKILAHSNYNPRIVEHMTQARNVTNKPATAFFDDFLKNLANPARVWDHAFRSQLTVAAQHVLLVMSSLPDEILLTDLETAFNRFFQFRRTKLGFSTSGRDFEFALKELDGNFVKSSLIGKHQIVKFHNPSVADFLEAYLANSPNDVADLFESVCFFDQFSRLWRGQGGTRFNGIDKHSERFIRAFAHQFSSPDCRLMPIVNSEGVKIGVHHWDKSFEARIVFAIEVANALKTPDSHAVVDQLLNILRARISSGEGEKEDLVRLLQTLNSRESSPEIKQAIFAAAKGYLTRDLEELDDFRSVGMFVDNFPAAVAPTELATIGAAFIRFCETYDDSWANEPDALRGVAEDFERVSSQLDVDVQAICEDLVKRAKEWESELRTETYESDDSDEERLSLDPATESIDIMFDGLLHEIDERTN